MYGKALALVQLGKHEEAIECYNKIIETSDKYLIGYLSTFEDLFNITCNAFILIGVSLTILGKSIESIKWLTNLGNVWMLGLTDVTLGVISIGVINIGLIIMKTFGYTKQKFVLEGVMILIGALNI